MLRAQLVSWFLLLAMMTVPCYAQGANPAPAPERSPVELERLLAPIALYPDPLLAIILPATTSPGDIALAARFIRQKKDIALVDKQKWQAPIKALTRYPEVLLMLDDKLEWATELGLAYVEQQADVMDATQRLRVQARNAENLVNTPQQRVIVERETVVILPANPQMIYVPQYDPQLVYDYIERQPGMPLVSFIGGGPIGPWLSFDCDWQGWRRRDWRPHPPANSSMRPAESTFGGPSAQGAAGTNRRWIYGELRPIVPPQLKPERPAVSPTESRTPATVQRPTNPQPVGRNSGSVDRSRDGQWGNPPGHDSRHSPPAATLQPPTQPPPPREGTGWRQ